MKNVVQNFSRTCAVCGKTIWYSTKSSLNRALRAGKPCQSCFIKSLWDGDDAPLRKEETRLKRNNSVSAARQDPTSGYNSPEYIEKQSVGHKALWDDPNSSYRSDEYIQKQSSSLKKVWRTEEYRSKRLAPETIALVAAKSAAWMKENYSQFISALKLSWTDDRKNQARDRFVNLLKSDEFKQKLWGCQRGIRVSKLELKIKDQMEAFGYLHSSAHQTYFDRCLPDFLNEQAKTIVEIYGDYWHCNPAHKIFGNPDWYHPKLKMLSSDKWALDFIRNRKLENLGYKVIVLWESDIQNNNFDISKIME